jgi:hypothetical protein
MVETLDVVRGRRVPCPPFGAAAKKRSTVGAVKPAKLAPSTDPYRHDKDLRLIMDLSAERCGVGLTLKFMAYLEVKNNPKNIAFLAKG